MRLPAVLLCLAATSAHAEDRFDCIMDPSLVIEVGSAVDGLIKDAFVTRGDDIVKGQLIAQLDARVEEAALAYARELAESGSPIEIAQIRLELIQNEVKRAERLLETNLVADSVVEALISRQSEAALELRQAENNQRLASLEQSRVATQLAQHEIRSPIDGIVITRMMSPGEFVYSQAPVAQLAQVDPIHVELMRSLAASNWTVIRRVRIPNALPFLMSALRLGSSLAIISAIVAEYFGGTQGSLGQLIT